MASEEAEIRRLIRATHRSLVPAPFPPRRDLDVAVLESGAGTDATVFHDAFWVRRDRFACFVVRVGGGLGGLLGAHALKALLRAALRSHPAERALDLGLRALRASGSDLPVDAAMLTVSTRTGEASLAAHGAGTALHLSADAPGAAPAGRARLACGEIAWLSVGTQARPGHPGTEEPDTADLVRAALAGTRAAAAAAIALRSLRGESGRTFVLANDVAQISPMLAEVEEYLAAAGLRPEAFAGLDVALDELLTNIVLYAYGDGASHEIVVEVRAQEERLHVEIRDDGTPFDPTAAAAPDLEADLDDRPVGGLGLHFVRAIFDTVAYRRAQGWNVLALSKTLAGDRAVESLA